MLFVFFLLFFFLNPPWWCFYFALRLWWLLLLFTCQYFSKVVIYIFWTCCVLFCKLSRLCYQIINESPIIPTKTIYLINFISQHLSICPCFILCSIHYFVMFLYCFHYLVYCWITKAINFSSRNFFCFQKFWFLWNNCLGQFLFYILFFFLIVIFIMAWFFKRWVGLGFLGFSLLCFFFDLLTSFSSSLQSIFSLLPQKLLILYSIKVKLNFEKSKSQFNFSIIRQKIFISQLILKNTIKQLSFFFKREVFYCFILAFV